MGIELMGELGDKRKIVTKKVYGNVDCSSESEFKSLRYGFVSIFETSDTWKIFYFKFE